MATQPGYAGCGAPSRLAHAWGLALATEPRTVPEAVPAPLAGGDSRGRDRGLGEWDEGTDSPRRPVGVDAKGTPRAGAAKRWCSKPRPPVTWRCGDALGRDFATLVEEGGRGGDVAGVAGVGCAAVGGL